MVLMRCFGSRFGVNGTREVGMDFAELRCKHVAVFTDRTLVKLPSVATGVDALFGQVLCYALHSEQQCAHAIHTRIYTALQSLEKARVPYTLYSDCRVEPTDTSFQVNICNSMDWCA
jgi:alcohol dehydrogenase class IV